MTKVAGGADGAAAWYLPTRSGASAAGGEVVAARGVSVVEAAVLAADAAASAASAPSVVITPGVDSVAALTVSSKAAAS